MLHYSAKRGLAIACRPSFCLSGGSQSPPITKNLKFLANEGRWRNNLYGGPIGTHQNSFPTPYATPFPRWRSQPTSKTPIAIISGIGKAMYFIFGRYIYRVHPNESPFTISEKRERGCIQGLPQLFGYPLLFQEWVKLLTSNYVCTFIGLIRTKAH